MRFAGSPSFPLAKADGLIEVASRTVSSLRTSAFPLAKADGLIEVDRVRLNLRVDAGFPLAKADGLIEVYRRACLPGPDPGISVGESRRPH